MSMRKRISAASVFVTLIATAAFGQASVDGIEFEDLGASGVIDLGIRRGSVAVIDYDDDGYVDLIIGDHYGLAQRLFHNEPDPLRPGERTFVDATSGSGLDDRDGTARRGAGVLAADYDNDGDTDVFLMGRLNTDSSSGLLYRNDGGGVFTNVSVDSGIRADMYLADSASWYDFDHDGDVDLLIHCEQGSLNRVRLLRNDGNDTFTDVSDLMPTIPAGVQPYSQTWMDYDEDGYADCFSTWNGGVPVVMKNIDDGRGGKHKYGATVGGDKLLDRVLHCAVVMWTANDL